MGGLGIGEPSGPHITNIPPMVLDFQRFSRTVPMAPIILWFTVLIHAGRADSPSGGGQNFIGRGTPGYQSLNGDVAEFVVFTSTLSDADRDRVHGYLAHKWGQTASLPGGNPYKTTAPLASTKANFVGRDGTSAPHLDMRVEFRNGIPATEPGKLDGLALWLDASDLSTVIKDSSNKVINWSDKSGNGVSVSQFFKTADFHGFRSTTCQLSLLMDRMIILPPHPWISPNHIPLFLSRKPQASVQVNNISSTVLPVITHTVV